MKEIRVFFLLLWSLFHLAYVKICINNAFGEKGKHILMRTSAGMNTCSWNFLRRKNAKSKRKQKLYSANRNKNESKNWEMKRKMKEKKKITSTQLATEASFCDIKSILFVRHFSCRWMLLRCRKFPWSSDHESKKMLKAAHRQQQLNVYFLTYFSFLFETTDNLETHDFSSELLLFAQERRIFF